MIFGINTTRDSRAPNFTHLRPSEKKDVSRPDFCKIRGRRAVFLLFIISYCMLSSHIITFPQGYVGALRLACEASVSVLFRSKGRAKNGASKRGGGGEERKETFPSFPSPTPLFHFLPLVSFLARPKPRISFLGLSLLRNSTETLAAQATLRSNINKTKHQILIKHKFV